MGGVPEYRITPHHSLGDMADGKQGCVGNDSWRAKPDTRCAERSVCTAAFWVQEALLKVRTREKLKVK